MDYECANDHVRRGGFVPESERVIANGIMTASTIGAATATANENEHENELGDVCKIEAGSGSGNGNQNGSPSTIAPEAEIEIEILSMTNQYRTSNSIRRMPNLTLRRQQEGQVTLVSAYSGDTRAYPP